LAASAGISSAYQFLVSDGWMKLLQFKLLAMDRWAALKEPWVFHERLDTYYYTWAVKAEAWIPKIMGTDVRVLGLRLTLDMAMVGVGGLIGIVVATSCLLGAFINFAVLAPMMIELGDIAPRLNAAGQPVPLNCSEIVNQWSMWWGVSMMVSGSLVGLLAKPELFTGAFKALKYRKYVRTYLGAFAYRFNHRSDLRDLIANLIADAARTKPVPKRMIRGRHAEAGFQR
jgi:hypothetical protein